MTSSGGAGKDAIIDFIAGSVGAAAGVYVGQPLDTMKVKMQTFPHLYPNLTICAKATLEREGVVRGLYAGTIPALVANISENSILFAAYGAHQKLIANFLGVPRVEDLSVTANGFSGFLAAFWSSLTLCPTELVKCRLQAMREAYINKGKDPPKIGPYNLTKDILKKEGVPGLFRGLTATFTREMPGYFFFFLTYEMCREALRKPNQTKDEIGPLKTVLSGGMAGVTLWTIIFPADVVKSRLQVTGGKTPMLRMMYQIYRNEGMGALYSGLGATLIRTFISSGVLFLAFEYTKKVIHTAVD
jgi:solute carrier family 25 ornithine transporter 2/15